MDSRDPYAGADLATSRRFQADLLGLCGFVVVMPGADREAAARVLERMAQTVTRECEAPDGRGIELTWGVADHTPGGTAEDLLAAADVALLGRKTEKRR